MSATPISKGGDGEMPKRPDGSVDVEEVRRLFMESGHKSWRPFANSMGWEYTQSRHRFPVNDWIREKLRKIHQEHLEEYAGQIFEVQEKIARDVMKSIRDYPEGIDRIKQLVDWKVAAYTNMIALEQQKGIKPQDSVLHDKITTMELDRLSTAISRLTEAKYKSLMLHDFRISAEMDKADTKLAEGSQASIESQQGLIVWKIKGGDNLTEKDYQNLWNEYMDRKVEVKDVSPDGDDAVPVPRAD